MPLNRKQIAGNYRQCLSMAADLMRRSILLRSGKEVKIDENNEVVLLAVSEPAVIGLISSVRFDSEVYRSILVQALDQAGRELFPDICKKRFTNIGKIENQVQGFPRADNDGVPKAIGISDLRKLLSKENDNYLTFFLLKRYSKWRRQILNRFSQYSSLSEKQLTEHINEQLHKMRLCFPDGQIKDTSALNGNDYLSDDQALACYKNVYCGIERNYPVCFLQRNGYQRAALITRFLIENILGQDPAGLLKDLEEVFFIRYKLQNVYRLFNYSANRAFHNAYKELIPPWLNSRTDTLYWELIQNRRRAVRWLVEEKMELKPTDLRKAKLHRKDFAENGLSYLFNQYYNSVSRALREAYPDYHPWELGPVPEKYWTDENANRAVRRVIELKGWDLNTLPEKVQSKEFTRQTFSEFGLATVFEKRFNRNIFRAMNAAYPERFMPWELGNVPAEFWKRRKNLLTALNWIAGREGISENRIFNAIDQHMLTVQQIKKYAIGKMLLSRVKGRLHGLFTPVYAARYHKEKIITRLENFIRREKQSRSWRLILLYGVSYPAVCRVSLDDEVRYQRMLRRIRRQEPERL